MSASPRYSSISSPSLSILASSALICMRAVLRSALIARRGHLGIKKCQSPELYRATQIPFQPIRSNLSLSFSSSFSQRTITISFSVWSQSKIVLCTSCLVGWQLPVGSVYYPPSESRRKGGETGLFIKKSSLIVWKEIMLISQFTRRQLRHADENENVGGWWHRRRLNN